jgi:hypothetical protein
MMIFYFNDLVNKAVLMKLQHKEIRQTILSESYKVQRKRNKNLKLLAEDKTTDEISKRLSISKNN